MGRELPAAEVLAADQRITAWARQLKAAGLDGDMDVLRARAYLDLLLGKTPAPARRHPPARTTPGRAARTTPGRAAQARMAAGQGRAARTGPRLPVPRPARCRPGSPGRSP